MGYQPKMKNNNNNMMMRGGNMANNNAPNNAAMPFPILSDEFMNNMMNMDFVNAPKQPHNLKQNSLNFSDLNPQLYNPQNVNNAIPPPPKQQHNNMNNNMQYINDMIHNPQPQNPLIPKAQNNGYQAMQKRQKSQPKMNEYNAPKPP